MSKIDPDAVGLVAGKAPPTDIPGLGRMVGRAFVGLHVQIRELQAEVRRLHARLDTDPEPGNFSDMQAGEADTLRRNREANDR